MDSNILGRYAFNGSNVARDTVIFPMQHVGFALNLEKSILKLVWEIEFLG